MKYTMTTRWQGTQVRGEDVHIRVAKHLAEQFEIDKPFLVQAVDVKFLTTKGKRAHPVIVSFVGDYDVNSFLVAYVHIYDEQNRNVNGHFELCYVAFHQSHSNEVDIKDCSKRLHSIPADKEIKEIFAGALLGVFDYVHTFSGKPHYQETVDARFYFKKQIEQLDLSRVCEFEDHEAEEFVFECFNYALHITLEVQEHTYDEHSDLTYNDVYLEDPCVYYAGREINLFSFQDFIKFEESIRQNFNQYV